LDDKVAKTWAVLRFEKMEGPDVPEQPRVEVQAKRAENRMGSAQDQPQKSVNELLAEMRLGKIKTTDETTRVGKVVGEEGRRQQGLRSR
jgi:hypothetical protein